MDHAEEIAWRWQGQPVRLGVTRLGLGPSVLPECLSQCLVQEELIRAADLVVALTRSERDLIQAYCPAARGRIRIVGNGVADHARAQAALRERRTDGDHVTVLFAGRFVDRKGVHELLAAAATVLDRAPATRFVLAGGHRGTDVATMARYWLPSDLAPRRDSFFFTG
jgi:glycosyltransferase involved in cell wall biosynthesis